MVKVWVKVHEFLLLTLSFPTALVDGWLDRQP